MLNIRLKNDFNITFKVCEKVVLDEVNLAVSHCHKENRKGAIITICVKSFCLMARITFNVCLYRLEELGKKCEKQLKNENTTKMEKIIDIN